MQQVPLKSNLSRCVSRVPYACTACGHRMAHRKWKETKLQPSMLPGLAVPGCSLVSFHFLWAILCPQAVPLIMRKFWFYGWGNGLAHYASLGQLACSLWINPVKPSKWMTRRDEITATLPTIQKTSERAVWLFLLVWVGGLIVVCLLAWRWPDLTPYGCLNK